MTQTNQIHIVNQKTDIWANTTKGQWSPDISLCLVSCGRGAYHTEHLYHISLRKEGIEIFFKTEGLRKLLITYLENGSLYQILNLIPSLVAIPWPTALVKFPSFIPSGNLLLHRAFLISRGSQGLLYWTPVLLAGPTVDSKGQRETETLIEGKEKLHRIIYYF